MPPETGVHRGQFANLFHQTQHRQAVCVMAVLTWIASCDGRIAPREEALLRRVAAANDAAGELGIVIDSIPQGRAEDLELACRFLRNHTDRNGKRLLLQLAVTMAVQDGFLSVAENYVLQFLADLLGLAPRTLAKLFQQIAHRPFPQAGDPSSIEWWRRREAGEQPPPAEFAAAEEATSNHTASNDTAPDEAAMNRALALRILGLGDGASLEAIHVAYRRLAKVRHPDRFARLGPAAVTAATHAFERLHEAYAMLSA